MANTRRPAEQILLAKCAAFLALAMVASGCAGGGDTNSTSTVGLSHGVSIPALDQLPEKQRADFADGKITLAEYGGAFDRFSSCASGGGGRVAVLDRDPVSGVVTFSSGTDVGSPDAPNLDTVEGRCYNAEFSWVELVFQTTDPRALQQGSNDSLEAFYQHFKPCLVANGETVPGDLVDGSAEMGALLERYVELQQQGLCGG